MLSPNPASSHIRFDTEDQNALVMELEIYNLDGQKVLSSSGFTGQKINIEELIAGIYYYKIHLADTEMTGKFVKL